MKKYSALRRGDVDFSLKKLHFTFGKHQRESSQKHSKMEEKHLSLIIKIEIVYHSKEKSSPLEL